MAQRIVRWNPVRDMVAMQNAMDLDSQITLKETELECTLKKAKFIQEEIELLREKRLVLESEKTKLKTDFKYIEEMAREKYRMAKKGEKVFKVIEKEND